MGRLAAIFAHEEILTGLGFSAEVALPVASAGKNAADLLLAQYATRLAERQAVETVAIVSSDGDFATVARGLAECGVQVIGFGRPEAPRALRGACALFSEMTAGPPVERTTPRGGPDRDLAKLRRVIDHALGKDGAPRRAFWGR